MRCLFFLIASTIAVAFAFGIPLQSVLEGAPKAAQEPAPKAASKQAEAATPTWSGEPYLLTTCAASGRPIEVKGTPTTKVIAGRELKFCCSGCAAAVEKDPAKWLGKVDAAQAEAQGKIYPTEICCVGGKPLMKEAADGTKKYVGTDVIVNNRLFRVCCAECAEKLKADPAPYALKLNEEVIKTQGDGYVFDACIVDPEGKLDGKGVKSMVIGGRLIKTCCGACEKEVRANPTKHTAMVDAAIEAKRARMRGEAVK